MLKDRKKTDKTIIDSQERAFWRVMRPSVSFRMNDFFLINKIVITSPMKHQFLIWIFEMICIHIDHYEKKKL